MRRYLDTCGGISRLAAVPRHLRRDLETCSGTSTLAAGSRDLRRYLETCGVISRLAASPRDLPRYLETCPGTSRLAARSRDSQRYLETCGRRWPYTSRIAAVYRGVYLETCGGIKRYTSSLHFKTSGDTSRLCLSCFPFFFCAVIVFHVFSLPFLFSILISRLPAQSRELRRN